MLTRHICILLVLLTLSLDILDASSSESRRKGPVPPSSSEESSSTTSLRFTPFFCLSGLEFWLSFDPDSDGSLEPRGIWLGNLPLKWPYNQNNLFRKKKSIMPSVEWMNEWMNEWMKWLLIYRFLSGQWPDLKAVYSTYHRLTHELPTWVDKSLNRINRLGLRLNSFTNQ